MKCPRADSARTSTVTSSSLRVGGATEEEGVDQGKDVLGSAGAVVPGGSTVEAHVPALSLCSFCYFFLTFYNLDILQHYFSSL